MTKVRKCDAQTVAWLNCSPGRKHRQICSTTSNVAHVDIGSEEDPSGGENTRVNIQDFLSSPGNTSAFLPLVLLLKGCLAQEETLLHVSVPHWSLKMLIDLFSYLSKEAKNQLAAEKRLFSICSSTLYVEKARCHHVQRDWSLFFVVFFFIDVALTTVGNECNKCLFWKKSVRESWSQSKTKKSWFSHFFPESCSP